MAANAETPQDNLPPLSVEGAWVRAMPPVSSTTAGYFTLYNAGPASRTLVQADARIAGVVEMHGHFHEDGVARMREADEVVVKPGASVEFAPGGYHLMFMGVRRPLEQGDCVLVTLTFADGSEFEVRFPVRARGNDG